MRREAIAELLALLPAEVRTFAGSQYPLPVKAALLGEAAPDLSLLRRQLEDGTACDVKELLEPALVLAELCEAASEDKTSFFLTDDQVRDHVFSGSKWHAGWALILGGADRQELARKLQEQDFIVFTDQPDLADAVNIGSRATAPVYFLQLMVRYGLIWGGIAPGDDHGMGHFLEKDMPGLLIVTEDLPPLKYLMALGLMKLGAPAVVPPTFPFPYGRRAVAQGVEEIVAACSRFPNLRRRYFGDEIIRLPDSCRPEWAGEKVTAARCLGGRPNSFFCLRPAKEVRERLTIAGPRSDDVGILVEVAAADLTPDVAQAVERTALKAVSYLQGVLAFVDEGGVFHLQLGAGVEYDEAQIGEAIYYGIRMEYPRLVHIAITFIYDSSVLAQEAQRVRMYHDELRRSTAHMTEEDTEEWAVCTECRPFSLVHTCILTPERPPMCAARSYVSVKAAARFGSSQVPWKRQSEKDLPMRYVFRKGRAIDPARGEYEGCNEMYRQFTGGQLQRVYLHSLRGHPHTSCGCFQNLAFWQEEVQGIGIMSRGSEAVTPDGQTWDMLANRAGGKQSPGITGVSLAYIHSPRFLQGDGGLANVVWADSQLYSRLTRLFAPGQKVATERDARSLRELARFVGR